ncbi:hypothetical protein WISP_53319 [Willisornis vidua]|uniref:Uncharacterized protein n=1 Tax=Willisornis vidua TaxID=1566151 RepID=A0ABQ9DDQ3_9PASS|nr:hypothetical protein WISP_53319 [Willisornis vidua]
MTDEKNHFSAFKGPVNEQKFKVSPQQLLTFHRFLSISELGMGELPMAQRNPTWGAIVPPCHCQLPAGNLQGDPVPKAVALLGIWSWIHGLSPMELVVEPSPLQAPSKEVPLFSPSLMSEKILLWLLQYSNVIQELQLNGED